MKFVGKLKNLQGKISKSIMRMRYVGNDEPFFDIDDITKDKSCIGYGIYRRDPKAGLNYFTLFVYSKVLIGLIDPANSTIYIYYYDGYADEWARSLTQCSSVVLPDSVHKFTY